MSESEYFKGARIIDTGAREDHYGATWRVCKWVEGHRAGDVCLRPMREDRRDYGDGGWREPKRDWR